MLFMIPGVLELPKDNNRQRACCGIRRHKQPKTMLGLFIPQFRDACFAATVNNKGKRKEK
jgi:hypothetical protein